MRRLFATALFLCATAAGAATAVPVVAAAASPEAAIATSVWRCGPAFNVYTDSPCPGGQLLDISAAQRSAAQRQAAQAVVVREAQALDRLVAERRAREAAAQGAAGIGGRSPPSAVSAKGPRASAPDRAAQRPLPRRHPPAADGTWRAIAPATRANRD